MLTPENRKKLRNKVKGHIPAIADKAGVTTVTVYRYFNGTSPNLQVEEIAIAKAEDLDLQNKEINDRVKSLKN